MMGIQYEVSYQRQVPMTTVPDDLMDDVRRDLAAWRTTHPRATFAELETAVEERIQRRLRAALLAERTDGIWNEERPACPQCGTTMIPRSRST